MQKVDYSRRWWIFAAIAPGLFLATIAGSIVNIALPTLVVDLNQPLNVVEWVVLSYLLTLVMLILSVGRLSDMIGRKRLYIAGVTIFTLFSFLNGIAPTVYFLIASRVFQAVGAALSQVLGIAIVVNAFPKEERGTALGVVGGLVSIGVIAGPTLGGLILGTLSWHWLFFVNVPVGIIGFFLALKFLPFNPPGIKQAFDFAGAGVLLICLASLLMGLTIGQNSTFGSPVVITLLVLAAASLFGFIRIEKRVKEPMLDLSLFASRYMNISLVSCYIQYISFVGVLTLLPFYLQNMRGFTPEKTGLMISVLPVSAGLISLVSGRLSDRFGTKIFTTIGFGLQIIGLLLMTRINANTTIAGFVLRCLPFGVGFGTFQSPNNSAIMGSAKPNEQGIVSGLLTLTRFMGITSGIAILTTIWTREVVRYAGAILSGGPTLAPVGAQIRGLDTSFYFIVGFAVLGLALNFSLLLIPSKPEIIVVPEFADPPDLVYAPDPPCK